LRQLRHHVDRRISTAGTLRQVYRNDLINFPILFISLATKTLKWEEPAEPTRIVGPVCFVGTKGLGAFLFTTY
jgi:hypothetical protein